MDNIEKNITVQNDTAVLLAESSSEGFIIDPDILRKQIDLFSKEVESQEIEVRGLIRGIMGWEA